MARRPKNHRAEGHSAFFNASTDTVGVRTSIKGETAASVIQGLPEFLEKAKRNYFVKTIQAIHPTKKDTITGIHIPVTNQYHLVRSDTEQILSSKNVSKSYAPLSLLDISEEIEPFCQQGWATPDSVFGGGVLPDGGESIEILCLRLDAGGVKFTDGEDFVFYMVIVNPHNGRKAQGKFIAYRPRCLNMFSALLSTGYDFTIPHRIGKKQDPVSIMASRVKYAVETWDSAKEKIRQLSERINVWNKIMISDKIMANLTDRLLGIQGIPEEKITGKVRNRRDDILAGFDDESVGTYGATVYDWLNSVTHIISSPIANAKSMKSPTERIIGSIDPNGSGFGLELRARNLVDSLA